MKIAIEQNFLDKIHIQMVKIILDLQLVIYIYIVHLKKYLIFLKVTLVNSRKRTLLIRKCGLNVKNKQLLAKFVNCVGF